MVVSGSKKWRQRATAAEPTRNRTVAVPQATVQAGCMKLRAHGKRGGLFISIAIVATLWSLFVLAFALLSFFGSEGPWSRKPDARVADEIEAKLSRVPCVGPMSRWERHYLVNSEPSELLAPFATFFLSSRWYNYRSVDIDYRQAGFEEFRGGRYLGRAVPPAADDRQYDLVFGYYDIPTHTAHLWACGPNFADDVDRNIVVR